MNNYYRIINHHQHEGQLGCSFVKVSTKITCQETLVFSNYWISVKLWSLPFLALTCMYYQKVSATRDYCLVKIISSFNVSCWDYKNEINYYSLSFLALKIIVYISCWRNHYSSFGLVKPPAPLSALSPSSTNSSEKNTRGSESFKRRGSHS